MQDIPFIPNRSFNVDFRISGLRFEENAVTEIDCGDGWFSKKIGSSPGPLISDFVTHGPDFEYATLGIHIGQIDRLTFFGDPDQVITGHFVDCREGSRTLHEHVWVRFCASPHRKLVIPQGVAHTFDGLAGIVTRDEPLWFSAENNPHWNVTNDLVSVLRTDSEFPIVTVNDLPFSDDLHLYLARLQQTVLQYPKAYMTRFELEIDGDRQYVMFHDQTWDNDGRPIDDVISSFDCPGVTAKKSKYAITGKASWTLVPNTTSSVCDVLWMSQSDKDSGSNHFLHTRTRKWYTVLTVEGSTFRLSTVDLRRNSETYGKRQVLELIADPRLSLCIEPGVAYRFEFENGSYVKTESEVLLDLNEPNQKLLPIGADLMVINPETELSAEFDLPSLKASDDILRKIASFEASLT